MFGTIIIDTYKKDETYDIADATDDICCANDNYGWSSAGIYCFWNYYTREVFYIGLAVDLHQRFMQHNGLAKIVDNSCKFNKITEYFHTYDKIGYTYVCYEEFLHSARTLMLLYGMPFSKALKKVREFCIIDTYLGIDTYAEMIESRYLDKVLNL